MTGPHDFTYLFHVPPYLLLGQEVQGTMPLIKFIGVLMYLVPRTRTFSFLDTVSIER